MPTRGKTITQSIRAQRRKAAEQRKADYDKLTLEQKLAKLPAGAANKQRARLEALIAAAKKPAQVESEVVEKLKPKKSKKQS
jgi:hypothetical protein